MGVQVEVSQELLPQSALCTASICSCEILCWKRTCNLTSLSGFCGAKKKWTCHARNRHGEFSGSHFVSHSLDTSNCASIAYHHQQPYATSQQFQWQVARHARRFGEKDRWQIYGSKHVSSTNQTSYITCAHWFLQLLQALATHHRHRKNKKHHLKFSSHPATKTLNISEHIIIHLWDRSQIRALGEMLHWNKGVSSLSLEQMLQMMKLEAFSRFCPNDVQSSFFMRRGVSSSIAWACLRLIWERMCRAPASLQSVFVICQQQYRSGSSGSGGWTMRQVGPQEGNTGFF